jgi:hypothetical protein
VFEAESCRCAPRSQQHLELRPDAPRLDGKLHTVHACGHDNVRKQKLDRLVAPQYLQRLSGVAGGHDLIAEFPQALGRDYEHVLA